MDDKANQFVRWKLYYRLKYRDGKLFAYWRGWKCVKMFDPTEVKNPEDGLGDELEERWLNMFKDTLDDKATLYEINKEQYLDALRENDKISKLTIIDWEPNAVQAVMIRNYGANPDEYINPKSSGVILQRTREELTITLEDHRQWFYFNKLDIPEPLVTRPNIQESTQKVGHKQSRKRHTRIELEILVPKIIDAYNELYDGGTYSGRSVYEELARRSKELFSEELTAGQIRGYFERGKDKDW